MKIAFTPSSLTSRKSTIVFAVHLINNKKVIAQRNFLYDVHIHNCKNPFALEPVQLTRLFVGESWSTSLSIFNPLDITFRIQNVAADDEDLEIKVPWDVSLMNDGNKDNEQKARENKDMSVIWNIESKKKQKFLYIGYKPETPGLKKINLFIETEVKTFNMPLVFKVKPRTLVLNKELYDLGVVTNANIPHEIQLVVSNPFNYSIQILEIYASVAKDTQLRIFQKDHKTVLGPLAEPTRIAKIRLLPAIDDKVRSYQGKILIQTNDTGEAHFIETKYRYAYYPTPLLSPLQDHSFFVRMQNNNIYTDRKDTFEYIEDEKTGGILELIKTVHITNNYVTALEFQKMHFPSNYVTSKGLKPQKNLALYHRDELFQIILRMPMPDLNNTLFNTWLALEAHGMLLPIHVNVYDKRLYCSLKSGFGDEITEKCFNLKDISLDFGHVAVNEVRRKTLTLINYNPNEITIVSINCSIPNCYTDVIEASLEYVLDQKDDVIMRERKVLKPWKIEKPLYKGLGSGQKAVFSFVVDKPSEESQEGEIIIQTIDEVIKLPLSYKTISGNLTFTPQIVRFQPGFPGKKQEARVAIKNLFNTVVTIKQVETESPEIIPYLATNVLNPLERVDSFKITFDPAMNKRINFLNTASSSGPYIYGITSEDLHSWKEAHNVWNELISSSSTEIREWIRIINDVSEKTFVQIRASLTNPLLIKDPINFGVTKLHSRVYKDITIENPSDLPIYVQLFIGPEEFSSAQFISSEMSKPHISEEIPQGVEDKNVFCLIDFMFENNEDDDFARAFLEDKNFQRYKVQHVNLDIYNSSNIQPPTKEIDYIQQGEDDLSQYANATYQCVEGNIHNIDSLILNYTEKFTKRLLQDENKPYVNALHFQNVKEEPVYEIRAMSYALPKSLRSTRRVNSVLEKMIKYFQDWFEFDEDNSLRQVNSEQSALMEKLKQNVKVIYVQNFNSIQKEQQIFLNPKYRDLSIFIPPHSNITIPALIHQPNLNKEYSVTLYIKNNLTSVFHIPVRGTGGSGNLHVINVKRYDEQKKAYMRSVTEELIEGDVDQRKMKFYIDKSEIPMVEAIKCVECPPGTKMLNLEKPFRRKFTLKNDGNLPIHITGISIQNLGCSGYGFTIENCRAFMLEPGHEQDLELIFVPDMSLTYFTRTLILYTNQGLFEFEIHVKMPFKHLYDDFDVYHFKSKWYIKTLGFIAILGVAAVCYSLIKGLFNRNKFKRRKAWQIQGQEILNYKHPNELLENIVTIKHNLGPTISAPKLIVPKRPVQKVEKPVRASKTPIKQGEFKEGTTVNLNRFEDSDGLGGDIKVVERSKKKSQYRPSTELEAPVHKEEVREVHKPKDRVEAQKSQPAREERRAEIKPINLEEQENKAPQTVSDRVIAERQQETTPKEKKPIEKKPYEKKTYERKLYEKRLAEKKELEKKLLEKKKVEDKRTEDKKLVEKKLAEQTKKSQPKPVQDKPSEKEQPKPVETSPKIKETPIEKEEKKIDLEEYEEEEEKYSEEKPIEESPGTFMEENFNEKQSVGLREEESDESLEGDILDDEMKNVAGSVIGEIKPISPVVAPIGVKASETPKYVEPQPQNLDQSFENSDITSEDDTKNVYNYFGNYRPVFNPAETSFPHNEPAQSFIPNQYGSFFSNNTNNNYHASSFGLGLFQTKRRTSRYDKYNYFPTSTSVPKDKERFYESPKKGPNMNKAPFFTGSEDESGVISESSVSSKPFYGQNDLSADEDKEMGRGLNIRKENSSVSFAQMFYPNMESASPDSKPNTDAGAFFDNENEIGEIDEGKLNYFFGAGVRFRNLKEGEKTEEKDSSELPPGLH